jgi:hypothetical protein
MESLREKIERLREEIEREVGGSLGSRRSRTGSTGSSFG